MNRIKSFKYDGGKVEMKGVETWGTGNEREWKMTCFEEPHPALPAALAALEKHVRDLLELPADWAKGSFRVIKVSWSYSDSTDVKGATVTCLVDLEAANSPLVINTPHLPYEQYSPTGNQPTMPYKMRDALDDLEDLVHAYLKGERRQMDLFSKQTNAEQEAPAEEQSPIEELTEQVTQVVNAVVEQELAK